MELTRSAISPAELVQPPNLSLSTIDKIYPYIEKIYNIEVGIAAQNNQYILPLTDWVNALKTNERTKKIGVVQMKQFLKKERIAVNKDANLAAKASREEARIAAKASRKASRVAARVVVTASRKEAGNLRNKLNMREMRDKHKREISECVETAKLVYSIQFLLNNENI